MENAHAHIVHNCLEEHGAKVPSGKPDFLVITAVASLMGESPNPKVHVVSRWLLGGWLDMTAVDGGGEENTTQRLRSAR